MARTGNDVLREELRARIGERMLQNALNMDPAEARGLLGEQLVAKIERHIANGGTAIGAANECHCNISLDDHPRWAALYKVAAHCLAEREDAQTAPSPVPA